MDDNHVKSKQCERCHLYCFDVKFHRFHYRGIVYDDLNGHNFCDTCFNFELKIVKRYEDFCTELGSKYAKLRDKVHVEGYFDCVKIIKFKENDTHNGLTCDLCLSKEKTQFAEFDFDMNCELACVNGDFCLNCLIYFQNISERYKKIFDENSKDWRNYMEKRNPEILNLLDKREEIFDE